MFACTTGGGAGSLRHGSVRQQPWRKFLDVPKAVQSGMGFFAPLRMTGEGR
ncbi:MAG: hypothetical protein WAN60_09575 [Candidatus Sulfotelmatobacter sp.]